MDDRIGREGAVFGCTRLLALSGVAIRWLTRAVPAARDPARGVAGARHQRARGEGRRQARSPLRACLGTDSDSEDPACGLCFAVTSRAHACVGVRARRWMAGRTDGENQHVCPREAALRALRFGPPRRHVPAGRMPAFGHDRSVCAATRPRDVDRACARGHHFQTTARATTSHPRARGRCDHRSPIRTHVHTRA